MTGLQELPLPATAHLAGSCVKFPMQAVGGLHLASLDLGNHYGLVNVAPGPSRLTPLMSAQAGVEQPWYRNH